MAKQKVNKHPDWQLTSAERKWYYIGDTGRLFVSTLVASYMTLFLMFQGISTAAVATAIMIVKIIDAADDVIFGFIVDKLKITEWKAFKKITGKANICLGIG